MAGRVLAGSGATEPRPKFKKRHAPTKGGRGIGPAASASAAGNAQVGNQGGRSSGGGRRGGNSIGPLVGAQIRAGVNDARKERRMVRREAGFARRQAIKDNKRAQGDLNYIFGETGDYMNAMGQQIDSNYSQASATAQQAQQALVAQLQQNSMNVASSLGGELAQFGITGMDGSALQHDALMSQQMATQQGSNNMANISAQQQGAAAISALLQGMNAGSKASQYGIQQNVLNDRLAEVYQNKRDGYNQVREAISDLRGTRGDLTLQMLQQLGGSGWAKYLGRGGGGGRSGGGRSNSSSYSGGSSNYVPQSSGSGGGGKPKGNKGKPGGSSFNTGSSLNDLLLGQLNSRRR